MNLRPYQVRFINDIRIALRTNRNIIACAATGSGKSKVFISIVKGAIENKRTALIITESTSIYGQIHKEIGNTINIGDGIKEFYLEPNKIYVAMAQTLAKRPGLIEQFNNLGNKLLIINDECHVGTATNVLLKLQDAFLIGFTATPDFRKAKHLPILYNDIVIGSQPQELIESGFLSPYFHFERQVADLSKLEKSNTGDYTEKSQEKVFEKAEVFDGILEDINKFEFHKCMIFCASINHCIDVVTKLRALNYDVSECHSKNKNTDYELFQFTNGSNNICVSVASLTKGFDFPSIDLIILYRATLSLPLYCQMIGRGSRTVIGKNKFTVLDYGGNGTRHKPWNYERDWSEMWNGKQKDAGVVPIKLCSNCGFIMPAKTNPCPECGTVTIYIPTEEDKKATELIEITQKYNSLRGRNISTLTPLELYNYVQATNKKIFGIRIAKAKGSYFLQQFAMHSKWKNGWNRNIIADTNLNFADIIIK